MLNFEKKIDGIEEDIKRNQEIIDQIKAAVKEVSKGDKDSIDKMQVNNFHIIPLNCLQKFGKRHQKYIQTCLERPTFETTISRLQRNVVLVQR